MDHRNHDFPRAHMAQGVREAQPRDFLPSYIEAHKRTCARDQIRRELANCETHHLGTTIELIAQLRHELGKQCSGRRGIRNRENTLMHGLHVLSRRTGNRTNFAIVQIEENWWIDAKLSAGTDRFFMPNFGKPFARRNS